MVDRHPLWGVTNFTEYEAAVAVFASKCLSWGAELVYANTLQSFYAVAAAHEARVTFAVESSRKRALADVF